MNLNPETKKKIIDGEIPTLVVDGLDGSGKSSTTNEITKILEQSGKRIVKVKYPQYNTPWGKFIKLTLNDPECDLNIMERMAIYAINRLESLGRIFYECEVTENSTILVFDRFSTSNIITLSYFLALNELRDFNDSEIDKYLEDNSAQIIEYIKLMMEIDSDFLDLSGFRGKNVVVLAIDPEISMARLRSDQQREYLDQYEDPKVQKIAAKIYHLASDYQEFNINILNQDGLQQKQLASRVIDFYGLDLGRGEGEIVIVNLQENDVADKPKEINLAIEKLLSKYPRLKNLNINTL